MPNLIVLNNKFYARDFRKYLLRAAAKEGRKALHIRYDESVILTYDDNHDEFVERWTLDELCEKVRAHMGDDGCLLMMGYGARKTPFVRALKKALPNLFVIYDVYDDFRYGAFGWQRLKELWSDYQCRQLADMTVVLNDSLRRRYPAAKFLLNASNVPKVKISETAEPKKLVYIGALDERIDFNWLAALTAQDISLDIYGYVNALTKEMEAEIENLLYKRSNVKYFGAYDNDNLSSILSNYHIGIVPYKTRTDLTRYINPDKVYHYLNAGLEVIATPFPQCVLLAKYLHLMRDPAREWREVFAATSTNPRNAVWPRARCSWEVRWKDLMLCAFTELRNNPKAFSCDVKAFASGGVARDDQATHEAFIQQKGPRRLHLGCGSNLFPGWYNTDYSPVEGAARLDFSQPFPFPDDCIDAMFCEHTIEHVSKMDAYNMLCETFRVLKSGASCRVVTPSLAKMAAMAVEPNSPITRHYMKWFRGFSANPNATVADAVNAMFYNHGHQHIFSVEELSDMLSEIGYVNLRPLETGRYAHDVFDGLDSHGKVIGDDITEIESFAIEAEKP